MAAALPVARPWALAHADARDDDDDDEATDDDDATDDDEATDDEEDEDQPPVTAGGLYTLATYPRGEVQRPLSMTLGILELRAAVGADMSNAHAFGSAGGALAARYGLRDNVELRADAACTYDCRGFEVGVAVEGSLDYDLVDLRAGVAVARSLRYQGATVSADDVAVTLPIGVPFRYAVAPQLAVTARETAIAIDPTGTPDATPCVAITIQPRPVVAIILRAHAVIPDFDFGSDKIAIPASAAVQITPGNRWDTGAELRFIDLRVPQHLDLDADGKDDAYYDARFLSLFVRLRR